MPRLGVAICRLGVSGLGVSQRGIGHSDLCVTFVCNYNLLISLLCDLVTFLLYLMVREMAYSRIHFKYEII